MLSIKGNSFCIHIQWLFGLFSLIVIEEAFKAVWWGFRGSDVNFWIDFLVLTSILLLKWSNVGKS